MKEDQLFYVGQKAFIWKEDKILVLGNPHGNLDFPGGKIQESENDLIESLKREVKEETGLEIRVGKPFFTWVLVLPSHHKNAGMKVFLIGYQCEYISGEVKLSDEHDKFNWVSKENYLDYKKDSRYFEALETAIKMRGVGKQG